jgi:hypothetical protein
MGYSHYFYRPETIENFDKIVEDTQKVLKFLTDEMGIDFANSVGDIGSTPKFTKDVIGFNGSDEQRIGVWTTDEDISIPWPSSMASISDPVADPIASKTEGNWFAGSMVSQRVAPKGQNGLGSGSYESIYVKRIFPKDGYRQPNENGLLFECCKTAYRPYDLAVTAFLIIMKHHDSRIKVSSDGEDKDWLDGKIVCHNVLGYGMDFTFNEE